MISECLREVNNTPLCISSIKEVKKVIKNHRLILYFVLTFVFSGLFWTIPIFLSLGIYKNSSLSSAFGLGVLGPIAVSTLLSLRIFGGKGVRDLASRFGFKEVQLRWYFFAALTFVGISLASLLVYFILDGVPGKTFQYYSFGDYISMMPVFLVFATFEEVGWRGFALPRLRNTLSPLTASIVLGCHLGRMAFSQAYLGRDNRCLFVYCLNDFRSFAIVVSVLDI
jgi:membrane protease YdiL (CAAX protease family)